MTYRVSVILPTYNRADLIGETIDSVLGQTRPVDDILVVDDGSTDTTADIVATYGDAVRYISKPNGGKSSALNLGLAETSGDLVWVCDDDDLLLEDACQRFLDAFDRDPGLGYCAGRHIDFVVDARSGEKQFKAPGYMRSSKPDELFSDLLDGCHIFQPGLMVKRAVYETVGPFNETLIRSQDYEMLLRIARTSRGRLLDETVFHHREHQGDRGSKAERFSMAEANAKWIRFHRIIMEPLIPSLSDAELLPEHIWNAPERAELRGRTAALKRASVYARNQLWPEAAANWGKIALEFKGPLDAYEENLIKEATQHNLGCDQLLDDASVRHDVLGLKRVSPLGKAITRLIARSLLWRLKAALKAGQVGRALSIFRFVIASAY